MLLYIWPDIKKAYPDAELHCCYGWKLFDLMAKTNPERRQWKKSIEKVGNNLVEPQLSLFVIPTTS